MTLQPHSKTHILHLNRTEGSGATSINETSCWQTRGTAKRGEQPTRHLNSTEEPRHKLQWESGERKSGTDPKPHPERFSHTGGVKQWAPRWHTCTTHSISFPTSWFLSHHRASRWQRGGAENSSHVYHVSVNSPQTPPSTSSVHLFQDGIQ